MKKKTIIDNLNSNHIIILSLVITSFIAFMYYYYDHKLNLQYYDAQSRLNISRKVLDNLTPGLAQLGNVWPFLPQVLMLPFIWNNYLWHSGLAGYFVSGTSFVLSILLLYKLGVLAFNSNKSGVLMALMMLLNINAVYMQTTAMSESLFIFLCIASVYYLIKWIKLNQLADLLYCALFISASTLTRYEGYFLLGFSVIVLAYLLFLSSKRYKHTEGVMVLFVTLASTGILLWMGYSWTIFGDPIYFARIYRHEVSIISSDVADKQVLADQGVKIVQRKDLVLSTRSYLESVAYMNGVMVTFFAIVGLAYLIYYLYKTNDQILKKYMVAISILIGPIFFVIFTVYMGSIPLVGPHITLSNLLNKSTNYADEYNIRYGLIALPLIILISGAAASINKKYYWAGLIIIVLQLVTVFYTNLFTIYSLHIKLRGDNDTPRLRGVRAATIWLKEHYDGGLIMVSALKHDPEMFYLGLDYKNYIHEGAGKYWLESRDNPQKYAKWVFMTATKDNKLTTDSVSKYLVGNDKLRKYYDLVYSDTNYAIYKIKDESSLELLSSPYTGYK